MSLLPRGHPTLTLARGNDKSWGMNRCAVCDKEAGRKEVFVVKGYSIQRCEACGVGSTNIPETFNPLSLYEESYFQGGQSDGYADYLGTEQVLRSEFRQSIKKLRNAGVTSGRLLEVGCAYGFFLQEAKAYFQCRGLEVAESAVEYCKQHGLDVQNGIADTATLAPLGTFD